MLSILTTATIILQFLGRNGTIWPLKFLKNFWKNFFGQLVWIEKKSHLYSRVHFMKRLLKMHMRCKTKAKRQNLVPQFTKKVLQLLHNEEIIHCFSKI